jgi:tetratricopeptide (TPR) repeat protein
MPLRSKNKRNWAQSKILAAAALAVLATFQIIRNAVVQEDETLEAGGSLWPRHPDVLRSLAMGDVGEAAGAGRIPSSSTMEAFGMVAAAAPYAPEPFLVRAALAAKAGDQTQAEQLLLHALHRNPRSSAGRFLLADLYLNSGKAAEGLIELARLTRILPGSSVPLAGALKQFAASGGTAAQLRQLFVVNPALENPVLSALASDAANADLVVAAASKGSTGKDERPPAWQEKLLNALVAGREYQKAYRIWLRLVGLPGGTAKAIFNPQYRATSAPPPFNWTFTSSAAGVAEGENGNLRAIHYGTEDTVLAKQLLMLSPGTYQMSMSISGSVDAENQLTWSITCLPSRNEILAVAVQDAGFLGASFEIPRGSCEAQQLELKGRAQEPVQLADVEIGPIRLERAAQ